MPPKNAQSISPPNAEAQFVLTCVAGAIANASDSDRANRTSELAAKSLDWNEVLRIASWHGVIPCVWRFVSLHADAMPESFVAAIRAEFVGNALRNLRLARELARIANALAAMKIGMLALKGPALAIATYGDLAMRQFTDLDILIREPDLPRVADLLAESGYYPRRYERDRRGGGFFQSSEDEFSSADGRDLIDVHWRLAPAYFPFAPDEEGLWMRAASVEIEGAHIATLATTDAMLFVIAHATKHGWPNLRAICDVAALAAAPSLDWDALAAQATRLGCGRMFLLGAMLAAEIAQARVPAEVVAKARGDPRVARLARRITDRLFTRIGARPGLFNEWMVPLGAIEGAANRIRYGAQRGLRPSVDDWEFFPLPRGLYPLYWIIRPFRLLAAHGPRLFSGAARANDSARKRAAVRE